jgi:hypothetical protein
MKPSEYPVSAAEKMNLRNHSGVKLALVTAGKLRATMPPLQPMNYFTNYFVLQSQPAKIFRR